MRISDWSSDVCSSDLVAIAYYSRGYLEAMTNPAGSSQNRQISLHQGRRILLITRPASFAGGHSPTLSARLDPPDIILTMTVRDPPVTIARMLRSEERRVGKEFVITCSSRWSPYP